MVHWIGGTGMFAILSGSTLAGIVIVIAAELVYELLERRDKRG